MSTRSVSPPPLSSAPTTAAGPSSPAQNSGGSARGRLRKLGVLLLCLLLMALLIDRTRSLLFPPPAVGHWSSVVAQEEYEDAYWELLSALPAPTSRHIDTGHGSAHVLLWESDNPAPPVLLLPGHSSGAPMWAENLPDFIGHRTVIAADPFGDAGLSSQRLPLNSPVDQATWISQLLTELGMPRVHVVGHSFGGATAAVFALHRPGQVASLTLLEPVMVIEPPPLSTYFWASLLLLPVPQSWKDRALAAIGGSTVEAVREGGPMTRMVDAAASGYVTAMPTPSRLSDEQWRSLTMPVRIDIAGTGSLAGGPGAVDRMTALLPNAETRFWPEATHSLPMEVRAELDPQLVEFWRHHDR